MVAKIQVVDFEEKDFKILREHRELIKALRICRLDLLSPLTLMWFVEIKRLQWLTYL